MSNQPMAIANQACLYDMGSVYAEPARAGNDPHPAEMPARKNAIAYAHAIAPRWQGKCSRYHRHRSPRTVRSAFLQTGEPGKHPHRMPANAFDI